MVCSFKKSQNNNIIPITINVMTWSHKCKSSFSFLYSCLNVFVKAEHDKILGQNDRKISSFHNAVTELTRDDNLVSFILPLLSICGSTA